MSDLRKAAAAALEALEEINKLSIGENAICLPAEIDGAMDALRQALLIDVSPAQMAHADAVAEPEQIGNARCPRCWEPITAPTSRKPLTDEELEPLLDEVESYDSTNYDLVKFARAIERAHGIGEGQ